MPAAKAHTYRLVVTRKLYDQGTAVQQADHLAPLATASGAVPVRLHPAELERLGVEPGHRVKVRSQRGEVVAEAVADRGVPRGIAAFVHDQSVAGPLGLIDIGSPITDIHVDTLS